MSISTFLSKLTAALAPKSKLDLGVLLACGYFPQELPPPFTTKVFADKITAKGLALPNQFMEPKGKWCEYTSYSLARPGALRRRLAILNPLAYHRLSKEIVTHQKTLFKKASPSVVCLSYPRISTDGIRAITTHNSLSDLPTARARSRVGKIFSLRTDIARFYPSIYTHSLDWAITGKHRAKAVFGRGVNRLGTRIDAHVQAAQNGQTRGIPIGPDTSLLLAHVLLAPVDKALKKRGITNGFRFLDDYELVFETRSLAEEALATLEEGLAEYELELNSLKTSIQELPLELETSAIVALRGLPIQGSGTSDSSLVAFFNMAFLLAKENPSIAILRFAVARINNLKETPRNPKLTQDLVLQSATIEPGVWRTAIPILQRLHAEASLPRDLRFFTGFQDTFQPSGRKLITRNYRSCRRIVETGNQVMADQGEPSIPNSIENGHVLLVGSDAALNYSEAEEILVEELGEQAVPILRIVSASASRGQDVAILLRTGMIATPEGMLGLDRWQKRLREFLPEEHRKLLNVSTTHGYKGKESEVVILLAPECYPLVHPDAIFSTIFGDTIETLCADERRLFYVGVTRARKTLFLMPDLGPTSQESTQIPFLAHSRISTFSVSNVASRLVCGGKVVVRLSNRPGCPMNGGTYPIRERLKSAGFKWSDETKIWSRILEQGSISSPFECAQYLQRQPWAKTADGIEASFAWEDQVHRICLGDPTITPCPPATGDPDGPVPIGGQWKPIPGWTRKAPHLRIPVASIRDTQSPQSPQAPSRSCVPQQPPLGTDYEFRTHVAGVTYENRAPAIRTLRVGDAVVLKRQPDNPKDANAIAVQTVDSRSLGFLPAALAVRLARSLDQMGGQHQATVTAMNPGEPNGSYLSLSIEFTIPRHPSALPPIHNPDPEPNPRHQEQPSKDLLL